MNITGGDNNNIMHYFVPCDENYCFVRYSMLITLETITTLPIVRVLITIDFMMIFAIEHSI